MSIRTKMIEAIKASKRTDLIGALEALGNTVTDDVVMNLHAKIGAPAPQSSRTAAPGPASRYLEAKNLDGTPVPPLSDGSAPPDLLVTATSKDRVHVINRCSLTKRLPHMEFFARESLGTAIDAVWEMAPSTGDEGLHGVAVQDADGHSHVLLRRRPCAVLRMATMAHEAFHHARADTAPGASRTPEALRESEGACEWAAKQAICKALDMAESSIGKPMRSERCIECHEGKRVPCAYGPDVFAQVQQALNPF